MEFFTGKTKKLVSSKFHISVAGKDFYYSGEEEKGYFLEEAVWNMIEKSNLQRAGIYECILTTPNDKYYISFNDHFSGSGEDTLSYSLHSITEEQIAELLGDQIKNPEEVLFFEYSPGIFSYLDGDEAINFSLDDLDLSLMVTGSLKIKIWIQKWSLELIAGFLLIAIPAGSIAPVYGYLSSSFAQKNNKLDIQIKQEERENGNIKRKIETTNKMFFTSKNAKDIFNSRDGFKDLRKIRYIKKKTDKN